MFVISELYFDSLTANMVKYDGTRCKRDLPLYLDYKHRSLKQNPWSFGVLFLHTLLKLGCKDQCL